MTTYSAASIYGIIDRMDAGDIQRWLDWHKKLKYPPRFITAFTAAKFEQGPKVLLDIKAALPQTTPVWRGYDGKDAWGVAQPVGQEWTDANWFWNHWNRNGASPVMAAGMWFNRRVKPYLNIIRDMGAVVHLLNEAAALWNAPYESECIRLLGEEGIRAGAFAWTAGTPADWHDYQTPQITDEVAMAVKYNSLVMTHEYCGIKLEEQNSLLDRNQKLVDLFPKDKKPDVFLGEFALCKATIIKEAGINKIKLEAGDGWREMPGITEAQYVDFINHTANTWYLPKNVAFSLFSWADWGRNGSFGVGKYSGLLDELAAASEWMTISVEDKPMPATTTPDSPIVVQKPPEAQIGVRAKVKSIPAEFRNLRAYANYIAPKLDELKPGDIVRRYEIPAYDGKVSPDSSGKWIYVEKLDGNDVKASGWIWRDRIVWEPISSSTQEIPATPAPAPEPPLPPDGTHPELPPNPPPAMVNREYKLVIGGTEAQHKMIEQAIYAVIAGIVSIGKALEPGMSISLNNDTVVA